VTTNGPVLDAANARAITHCQLCGGNERTLRLADGPFQVMTCRCGFVYVTPRLDGQALLDVYGASYWKSDDPKARGYADYARESALYLKTYHKRMALVSRWLRPNARILDVGCAAGYFLRVAREHGHDVHGCELSAAIAQDAIATLGADRVHVGLLDDAVVAKGWRPNSFDLVTAWDVIEHVPEPQALLDRMRTLIAPGGKLLLETQNVASRWARLLGKRWHHFKHLEHIYHFTPATIRSLLEARGFRVLDLGSAYAGKYVSFAFLAERAARLGRIAAILAKPLGWLAGCNLYVNPQDEMIVVAEPR
jgi:SAM-dependent methyltransferase